MRRLWRLPGVLRRGRLRRGRLITKSVNDSTSAHQRLIAYVWSCSELEVYRPFRPLQIG